MNRYVIISVAIFVALAIATVLQYTPKPEPPHSAPQTKSAPRPLASWPKEQWPVITVPANTEVEFPSSAPGERMTILAEEEAKLLFIPPARNIVRNTSMRPIDVSYAFIPPK